MIDTFRHTTLNICQNLVRKSRYETRTCHSVWYKKSEWQFLLSFDFFFETQKNLNFERHNSDFQPNSRKEVENKIIVLQTSCRPKVEQLPESLGFLLLRE